jgi:hypothetical protein
VSYDLLGRLISEADFRIQKIRYYNVLLKAIIEDVLLPLAEHNVWGKQVKLQAEMAVKDKVRKRSESGEARVVTRPSVGRWAHGPLALATALMKLDVILFGRIRTGPFFLLLRAVDPS